MGALKYWWDRQAAAKVTADIKRLQAEVAALPKTFPVEIQRPAVGATLAEEIYFKIAATKVFSEAPKRNPEPSEWYVLGRISPTQQAPYYGQHHITLPGIEGKKPIYLSLKLIERHFVGYSAETPGGFSHRDDALHPEGENRMEPEVTGKLAYERVAPLTGPLATYIRTEQAAAAARPSRWRWGRPRVRGARI